jgi:uncharacterized membrane protein YfcA
MWLALTLAAAIGLVLGLMGGGGAIITVPVLVYAAHVPPGEAVSMSLAVVGATSLVGALLKARQGFIHVRAVLWFSGTGIVGALAGAQLTPLVSPLMLLTLFALLMIAVAVGMLLRKEELLEPLPECRPWRCSMAGLAVGVLTGFLGVGGGFLLVPVMVLFARLPLKVAVGTSLAVIAVNSFAGIAGHWRHTEFNWPLTGGFTAAALAGMGAGLLLTKRVPVRPLSRAFAWFVLAVAGFVLFKNGVAPN